MQLQLLSFLKDKQDRTLDAGDSNFHFVKGHFFESKHDESRIITGIAPVIKVLKKT